MSEAEVMLERVKAALRPEIGVFDRCAPALLDETTPVIVLDRNMSGLVLVAPYDPKMASIMWVSADRLKVFRRWNLRDEYPQEKREIVIRLESGKDVHGIYWKDRYCKYVDREREIFQEVDERVIEWRYPE